MKEGWFFMFHIINQKCSSIHLDFLGPDLTSSGSLIAAGTTKVNWGKEMTYADSAGAVLM